MFVRSLRMLLLSLALLGTSMLQAADKTARVYIGTYTSGESQGIYTFELDLATGKATEPKLAAELTNPSFLAFDPKHQFLYAVNEVSDLSGANGKGAGGVTAYQIDATTGALTKLNSQLSVGAGPCHLSVDSTGRNVLVANYGGGSVAVLPIHADGSLKPASSFVQHEGSSVNPGRQKGPHAHSVNLSADNRYAFVADLGLDKVLVYKFNAEQGSLEPNDPPAASVNAGGGPRHFAFHPNGKFAYSNNEMTLEETVFSYDPANGVLNAVQYISTWPEGADRKGGSTAETQVHPSGKFLYVSNRGNGSIAIFQIGDDGRLTTAGHVSSGGTTPRNFGLDPTGHFLLAANQDNGVIAIYRINQETGALTPTGDQLQVPNPVCVRMFIP